MPVPLGNIRNLFERGAVIVSVDTEQIWGYFDRLSELRFQMRYPDTQEVHEKLLQRLCAAGVSATWFVVGGLTLNQSEGQTDRRMVGLPSDWIARIPSGDETTAPMWYRRSFMHRLRNAQPYQEIGLHGGLTHFIWTDVRATRETLKQELAQGIKALEEAFVRPVSFSFGREQEACYELLVNHGIRGYRGRTPVLAYKLGPTMRGVLLRMLDELARATPPPIWPQETLPGLWNIPPSLFLYPIGPARASLVPLRSRLDRFNRGLEAAIRHNAIFHFCLHPENLAESPYGFSLFEEILESLGRARKRWEIEVITVSDVVARMESIRETPLPDAFNVAPVSIFRNGCSRC